MTGRKKANNESWKKKQFEKKNNYVETIKRNQTIRDDILEMNDMMPSMTRQTQDSNPKTKPSQNKFAKKKKK